MIMKKFILAIIILGIVSTLMACKKDTAGTAENIGSTAVEALESSDAATTVPMETVDNLQIELEEGQVGEVAPD